MTMMGWQLCPADSLFDRYEEDWKRLSADTVHSHPIFDRRFVEAAYRHFGEPGVRLAVLDNGDRVAGLGLVEPCGFGRWAVFRPSQAPLGFILMADDLEYEDRDPFLGLIKVLPGHAFQLSFLHLDPEFCRFPDLAGARRAEIVPYGLTMKVTKNGSFQDYWSQRSKNLRKNISRYGNRVEREGIQKRVSVHSDPADMPKAVADYGKIESSGWKGKQGSAIHEDNVQGRFYTDLMTAFAESGSARVFNLLFDETLVASRLTITNNGMMVILKTTFSEAAARYAPGRMLLHYLLEGVFADPDIQRIEFYTRATEDQLQWSDETREIYHLNYYRNRLTNDAIRWARRLL